MHSYVARGGNSSNFILTWLTDGVWFGVWLDWSRLFGAMIRQLFNYGFSDSYFSPGSLKPIAMIIWVSSPIRAFCFAYYEWYNLLICELSIWSLAILFLHWLLWCSAFYSEWLIDYTVCSVTFCSYNSTLVSPPAIKTMNMASYY